MTYGSGGSSSQYTYEELVESIGYIFLHLYLHPPTEDPGGHHLVPKHSIVSFHNSYPVLGAAGYRLTRDLVLDSGYVERLKLRLNFSKHADNGAPPEEIDLCNTRLYIHSVTFITTASRAIRQDFACL